MHSDTEKVLVFSIAMNGYQHLFHQLTRSHKQYAERLGFDYVLVDKPGISQLGMECAWLKIALIIRAMELGYDWILFLDADTRVSAKAPDMRQLDVPGKDIYMAKGYSGRYNSGVIAIKNTPSAQLFFKTVLSNARQSIPREDDVGWGENGHIIHFAKRSYIVEEIDPTWNNNCRPDLDDYIRHYSAGPLRQEFRTSFMQQIKYLAHRFLANMAKRLSQQKPPSQTQFFNSLGALLAQVSRCHPKFRLKEQT